MKPLLFGLNIATSAGPGDDPVRDALAAESAGYDFVSSSDHPAGTQACFETWTMLTFIAAATTRIKVASRVLGVPMRSPALVAKMAESLQRLSGGRLILGLGGGSGDDELRAYGLSVPSAKAKIDGLADAVKIAKGLWSQPQLTYKGDVYHASAAPLEPKPDPPIPIWLGTFGPRGLAVTGQLADGWIPSLGYKPTEQLPAMLSQVLDAAEAAGRCRDDITCALNVSCEIDSEPRAAQSDVIAGSPEAIAERLLTFTASGFNAFNFMAAGPTRNALGQRLAYEVIPIVRANA